ncbi:MAG TPA: hypothetical protein VGI43_12750 [Mucilaginibacter sp.]|jgi:hypothetical protein
MSKKKPARLVEPCELCEANDRAIISTEPENDIITVTYKCENGHEVLRVVNLKER